MIFMVQVNRVCLMIIFFNRPQFLVDSNEREQIIKCNFIINNQGLLTVYQRVKRSSCRGDIGTVISEKRPKTAIIKDVTI